MSVEHAKAFIEKMKTDEAFREKIMAIETPEERLKAIGAAGFECTGEEINEAGTDVGQSAGGGVYRYPVRLDWVEQKC
ncbi:Nif11-like leader peptide family natural product precursor [Chlorobium limicola]